jgi:WD40 repeat protein
MHDLQRDFTQLVVHDLPALHRQLVDAFRATLMSPSHTSLNPADEWAWLNEPSGYMWHFLSYHLHQAGLEEELAQILTSPDWLFEKLTRFSVPALLSDFRFSLRDAGMRAIRNALILSAHVLSKEPAAVMDQLAGRLLDSKEDRIQRLINRTPRALETRPSLRPTVRSLAAPGGPLLRAFDGHTSAIHDIAVLRDGLRAVSASTDGTLKLWDLRSGAALQTLKSRTHFIGRVAVLPDGSRVLSVSLKCMELWDLRSGVLLQTFEVGELISSVTVLPDAQRALQGELRDGGIRLWDLVSAKVLTTLKGHHKGVYSVTVLPDGQALSASYDGTLILWDVTCGTLVHTFGSDADPINAFAVFPDGKRMLSATGAELKLWDLMSRTIRHTFKGDVSPVDIVTALPDGRRALSASKNGMLTLWDLTSGTPLQEFKAHACQIHSVSALPDGERALSSGYDGRLILWNLTSGKVMQMFVDSPGTRALVAILPDGQRALTSTSDRLKLWDLNAEQDRSFETVSGIGALAVLPGQNRLLSASFDGSIKLWDLQSGTCLRSFEQRLENLVTALTILPDGKRALSGELTGTIHLWDLVSGTLTQTFEGGTVTALTVLPDGERVFSASDDSGGSKLTLWELASGTHLRDFGHHRYGISDLMVLPDGRRALSGTEDGTVKLWELESGTLLETYHHSDVGIIRTIPLDEERALSIITSYHMKLWDLRSGKTLQTLRGHTERITGLAILSDKQRAFSTSTDGTLKVWDLTSGTVLTTFHGDVPFHCLAVVRNTLDVAAGDQLGRLHVFKINNM